MYFQADDSRVGTTGYGAVVITAYRGLTSSTGAGEFAKSATATSHESPGDHVATDGSMVYSVAGLGNASGVEPALAGPSPSYLFAFTGAGTATGSADGVGIKAVYVKRLYAFEWGERVRIRGAHGRVGQVTPPA